VADALDLALWLHAETVWQRDQARNQFLDLYNAASEQLNQLLKLEAALRDRTAERDRLRDHAIAQEQVLEIVRAQTDDCVRQVDAALGHRYHTRGVHYSVPHVAEKAAAELAQLQARIDAARAQHAEIRLYRECGHQHVEGEPGVRDADDAGLVCEDGYLYSICQHCCTDDTGYQSDACGNRHDDGRCWPCPTRKALDGSDAARDA
jgi:hypothetical protein